MTERVLAVVAHFDREDRIDEYFLFLIEQLKEVAEEILVVSVSGISSKEFGNSMGPGVRLIKRENVGYDFASWKKGLAAIGDLSCYDLVILANDSVYVGRHCFSTLFGRMKNVDCDIWGVTDSLEIDWHLQSYFLVFKPAAFLSTEFERFWTNLDYSDEKRDVILKGEVGLSQSLLQAGLRCASVFRPSILDRARVDWRFSKSAARLSSADGSKRGLGRSLLILKHFVFRVLLMRNSAFNPSHMLWDRLIQQDIRVVKIELLRSNPMGLDLAAARRILSAAEFPVGSIEAHLTRVGTPIRSA